ncbi:hypothetical protein ACP70R_032766 [Stipagrostis hirtigluma subsp. patula]
MPKSHSVRKASSDGRDSLGALPDGVLEQVLSFLPSLSSRTASGCPRPPSRSANVFLDHLLLFRGRAPIDGCVLLFDEFKEWDVPKSTCGSVLV